MSNDISERVLNYQSPNWGKAPPKKEEGQSTRNIPSREPGAADRRRSGGKKNWGRSPFSCGSAVREGSRVRGTEKEGDVSQGS